MNRLVDLFVFDLAGTVFVDEQQVLRAFLATAEAFDVAVDVATLRGRMGWHKERVFATVLGEQGRPLDVAHEMAQRFEQEYAELLQHAPLRPTPGAFEVIHELAQAEVRIALNTGFSRATADLVIENLGLQQWPSVASDEVAAGRPAPDLIRRAMQLCDVTNAARVGVAGDTPADLAAGMAAGARFVVGVGCGTHSLQELGRNPHTHLLPDLTGLPALVLPR